MLTAALVLARILANPISNVFQKQLTQRAANPLFVIGVTHALLTVVCLPILLAGLIPRQAEFWLNMIFCAALAVASNVLLVYALRLSDLSVLGPLNAYKAIISMVLGVFLIGEVPSTMGLGGMLLILAGSYFIVDRQPGQAHHHALAEFFGDRGIQLRFAALLLSATEAVFLKKALLLAPGLTVFVCWSVLGLPLAVAAGLLLGEKVDHQQGTHWRTYMWLAMATGTMQLTTILTFGKLPVGYSLSLFQLSTLVGVFLGYRYFQERQIRKRLIGSLIMIAGAILIVVKV